MVTLKAPPGLKGLEVSETEVGTVRGDLGFYHYRGHNAADFATRSSFHQVLALLHNTTDDVKDDAQAHTTLANRLGQGRASVGPEQVAAWWATVDRGTGDRATVDRGTRDRATVDRGTRDRATVDRVTGDRATRDSRNAGASYSEGPGQPPVTPLITALLSTVDTRPTTDMSPADRQDACLHAIALAPTVLGGSWRLAQGYDPIPADPSATHATDYLHMVTGRKPTAAEARAVEVYLNLTAEHGFNASTFAARVITSTGASIPAALSGAIGALLGPLHGGAPSRVLDMINAIGDPADTERWAQRELDAGRKLMGFGHAVYRVTDPRSVVLKEVASTLPQREAGHLLDRASEIEGRIHAVLKRHRQDGTFITNVEYYAAVVLALAGIPQEMFTATFVVSRLVGWTAHILEQAANNKIMRPSARYVGPLVDVPG